MTWNASNRLNLNGRFSYLPANENVAGPVWRQRARTRSRSAPFSIRTSAAPRFPRRNIVSSNFVIDGLFGFTRQHTYQEPPGKGHVLGSRRSAS